MEMDDHARSMRAISTDPEATALVTGGIDRIFSSYEKAPWLRALIQWVPGAGPVDTLLAWRGTHLNQQRVEELLRNVDMRISHIEGSVLNKDLLQSEEFFELFRSCVQTAAHAASEYKRGIVADFLAGTIERGFVDDLSQQIAEDIRALQELHLHILAALPALPQRVSTPRPKGMSRGVYMKAMTDLERMGFVHYLAEPDLLIAELVPSDARDERGWVTTEYVQLFKEAVLVGNER